MRGETCYYHTNHLGINDLIFRVSIWKYDDKPDQQEQLICVGKSIKWQENLPLSLGAPSMHNEDECGARRDQEGTSVQCLNQGDIIVFTRVHDDLCMADQCTSTSSLKKCNWRIKDCDLPCGTIRGGRIVRDHASEKMQILAAIKYGIDGNYDETVLCTLKFNRDDGLLAVNPGFSNIHRRMLGDDEEDDAAIDILSLGDIDSGDVQHNLGLPLYHFKTAHNNASFRYILECKNMAEECSELENMSIRLINAEYDVISQRQKNALSIWKQSCSFLEDSTREDHILHIEIESVRDFPFVHSIFVNYKIIASDNWTVDNKINLCTEERDSFSQLASSKLEVDNELASIVVTEGRTVTSSQPSTYMVDARNGYVSFCLFIISTWTILSCYLGLEISAILTLLLLIVLDEIFGVEMTRPETYSASSSVHVGHCISLYRRANAKVPIDGALEFEPKLNIKVYRKRTDAVCSLLGETEFLVPVTPGYQEIDVHTTLPSGNMGFSGVSLHLKDFYLGTAYMVDGRRENGGERNNYVSTTQSGVVRLRIQNISNFKNFVLPPSGNYLCSSEMWEELTKEPRLPPFLGEGKATHHQSMVSYTTAEQGSQLRVSEKASKVLEGIRKRRETRLIEDSG